MAGTTPDAATRSMIDILPDMTGKPLDQWLKRLAKTSLEKHGEVFKPLNDVSA